MPLCQLLLRLFPLVLQLTHRESKRKGENCNRRVDNFHQLDGCYTLLFFLLFSLFGLDSTVCVCRCVCRCRLTSARSSCCFSSQKYFAVNESSCLASFFSRMSSFLTILFLSFSRNVFRACRTLNTRHRFVMTRPSGAGHAI